MNSFLRPPRSIRPGTLLAARSQSLSQAKQNIKEDAGNSVADLAKRMAGANVQGDGVKDGFIEITGAMASQVPKSALTFGLAGGVPYVGADATTVYLTREPGLAAAANIDPASPSPFSTKRSMSRQPTAPSCSPSSASYTGGWSSPAGSTKLLPPAHLPDNAPCLPAKAAHSDPAITVPASALLLEPSQE
ncbi:hypothetical protein B0H10DRAFT_1943341 [Mycena sp. CBHHK59/15]|nr:hypothetical protein B0H10DRAFT_1943341 [Mycena sp. CBHHK59/15]